MVFSEVKQCKEEPMVVSTPHAKTGSSTPILQIEQVHHNPDSYESNKPSDCTPAKQIREETVL